MVSMYVLESRDEFRRSLINVFIARPVQPPGRTSNDCYVSVWPETPGVLQSNNCYGYLNHLSAGLVHFAPSTKLLDVEVG